MIAPWPRRPPARWWGDMYSGNLRTQTWPATAHFSRNAVFQGLSEFSERLLVKTSTYLSYCYLAALGWDGGLVNLHTVAPEVSMYP